MCFKQNIEFLFHFLAKATPKQEVKACYECKGVDACRSGRLSGSSIRTSAVFGAKNLYCYTVSGKNIHFFFHLQISCHGFFLLDE